MYRILKSWLNDRIKQQFIEQTTNLLGNESNQKINVDKSYRLGDLLKKHSLRYSIKGQLFLQVRNCLLKYGQIPAYFSFVLFLIQYKLQ